VTGREEVARLKARLDATFGRVSTVGTDLEVRSDFARFLCVLVSGYLEKAIQELATECCRRQSAPAIQRYAGTQLKNFQNPNRERILQLVGAFDPSWRSNLQGNYIDELDACVSVVALRHQIAHGESVSVSYDRIRDHYGRVQRIVDALADMFVP
jgi:hypothetical protein